jgi:hypothetical protein
VFFVQSGRSASGGNLDSQESVNKSQLAASIQKKKRLKDRSETRHQRVRTHCKREIVTTTSGVVNKQRNRSSGPAVT